MRPWLSVLLAGTLAAACSSGDDGGQARTVDPPRTTTTPADETTTTISSPTPEAAALEQVVVQLSDMPTGWAVSPPEEEESDDAFCDGLDPFNEVTPQDEAESTFQQSDFGPFVASGASLYKDDDEAAGVMDRLTDMANTCQSFTQPEDDGTETEYTISALSFPDLGDDTFAFRMAGTTAFGPLNLDVVAVRDGALVLAVINGGLGAADSELTESLMQTMAERV